MDSKLVLLADDDEFAQTPIKMMLGALKAQVVVVADGKQALETYIAKNGEGITYVLMDLNMPVMDGFESTKQIRAFEKSKGLKACKILGLSAGIRLYLVKDNDAKTKQACITSGMDDLLAKPVKKDTLGSHL